MELQGSLELQGHTHHYTAQPVNLGLSAASQQAIIGAALAMYRGWEEQCSFRENCKLKLEEIYLLTAYNLSA